MKITLDTNCLVDLAECRPAAIAIRSLVDAHLKGLASVAVLAITASEKQSNGSRLRTFNTFKARLDLLSIGFLDVILPMSYLGICYHDNCLLAGDEMIALEQQLHSVLFPDISYKYSDYCKIHGMEDGQAIDPKWLNAKCDVQAIWSHIYHGRDIFVTRDRNFHKASKKPALISLGAGEILEPDQAARRLAN